MADGEAGQQIVIRDAHAGDTMALAELAHPHLEHSSNWAPLTKTLQP